MEDLESVSKL